MRELNRHDLQWILQRTPPDILAAIKHRPGKLFLAGGFIRACIAHEEAQDIDLFVSSKYDAHGIAAQLCAQGTRKGELGARKSVHETENAYTVPRAVFGLPVQVISRWVFATPQECAESFDFTIAKSAIWWEGDGTTDAKGYPGGAWKSLCHEDFYADLAAKRLIYVSPVRNEDPGGSMLRVLKFYQRGYRIPLGSLGAVMARMVAAITPDRVDAQMAINPDNTGEQNMSVLLTEQLREVDPALDPSHLAHLSDPPTQSTEATNP
jgi:hypothetical protein